MCSRLRQTAMTTHQCMSQRSLHGPLNYCASHVAAVLIVSVCLLVGTSEQLPTRVQQHRSASDSESLSDILKDLENAMFRLKDYALRVDYENRKASTSNDFDDPSAEINEKDERHVMDDIYPELVAEAHDKKSTEDSSNRTSLISQQQQQQAVVVGSLTADASKEISSPESKGAATSNASKPTSGQQAVDDISLREALEFLVNLAKQKKQEKRDHDIPFPLESGH